MPGPAARCPECGSVCPVSPRYPQRNHDASWAEPGLYGGHRDDGCRRPAAATAAQTAELQSALDRAASSWRSADFRKMRVKPPVICASGARCDITRLVPQPARGAARLCKEAQRPEGRCPGKAVAPARSTPTGCARSCWCASPARGAASPRLKSRRSGAAVAHRAAAARNGARCSKREIEALAAAGLVTAKSGAARGDRGRHRAAAPCSSGSRAACRASGSEVRDVRLVAMALGLRARAGQAPQGAGHARWPARGHRARAPTASRSRAWRRPSRLRAGAGRRGAEARFRRQEHGGPRRQARAVGQGRPAARGAARRTKPRDFGTDTRLIAALAAEHVGAAAADLAGAAPGGAAHVTSAARRAAASASRRARLAASAGQPSPHCRRAAP